MKKALFALVFSAQSLVIGQTAFDLNLGAKLTTDSSTVPPTYSFSWWGKSGHHYFVETSTDLLSPWTMLSGYNPSGNDEILAIQFVSHAPRIFFRAIQFDPFDTTGFADSDTDGLPDKWEQFYFGDLTRDGTGDWNNDGLLDRDAFQFGLNPKGEDESEVSGKFDAFNYDARGWLDAFTLRGSNPVTFGLDNEGNIETAN